MVQNFVSLLRARERGCHGIEQPFRQSHSLVSRLRLTVSSTSHRGCVNTVQFDHTGNFLVSGSDDRFVNVWDVATKQLRSRTPTGHTHNIFCARILAENPHQILTSAGDGQLRLTDTARGVNSRVLKAGNMILKFTFLPDLPSVAVVTSLDGVLRLADLREPQHIQHSVMVFDSGIGSVSVDPFSPTTLAIGDNQGTVTLVDLRAPRVGAASGTSSEQGGPRANTVDKFTFDELPGQADEWGISGLDFSSFTPHELAVNVRSGPAYLFHTASSLRMVREFHGRQNKDTFAKDISFLFGGNFIGTGCDSGDVFVWDKHTSKLVLRAVGDSSVVNSVCGHPSLPLMVTSGIDNEVRWWECGEDLQPPPQVPQPTPPVYSPPRWGIRTGRHILSVGDAATMLAQVESLRQRGNDLFRSEDYAAALGVYQEAHKELKHRCSDPAQETARKQACMLVLGNMAACNIKLGTYAAAVANCDAVLELDPTNAKAFFRRALANLEMSRLEEARTDLAQASLHGTDGAAVATLERRIQERARLEHTRQRNVYRRMFSGTPHAAPASAPTPAPAAAATAATVPTPAVADPISLGTTAPSVGAAAAAAAVAAAAASTSPSEQPEAPAQ
eukprot:m.124987 g.124987  ORF g.124987 m.124987 type:complete len:616 (-) comp14660_c0_seq8:23-1870(-)